MWASGPHETTCAKCGAANSADAKFCDHCGAALSLTCPSCGHANAAGSAFCSECGKPLN
jgi:adenylate cyclase